MTDEYHTYDFFKVEVTPKKKKKKEEIEPAPIKEKTPSPKAVEKQK